MNEDSEDSFEISDKDFDKVMKDFELKNKRGYDLLVKGGKEFKNSIFKLCKRMIVKQESFPVRFEETILQQIYKGKGSK